MFDFRGEALVIEVSGRQRRRHSLQKPASSPAVGGPLDCRVGLADEQCVECAALGSALQNNNFSVVINCKSKLSGNDRYKPFKKAVRTLATNYGIKDNLVKHWL